MGAQFRSGRSGVEAFLTNSALSLGSELVRASTMAGADRMSMTQKAGRTGVTATLKRKLAEAQSNSAGPEMTALRALRLSVARAGDDLFDMALGVAGIRQQRMVPEDMADVMSDDDLLIVLDCPEGQTGAATVSLPLVSSLIQQQTMGMVSDSTPVPRPFTDTDAAMCAPLLEGVLSRAAALAEAEIDQTCFRAIRFGARGEDVRSMMLGLRAQRYRLFWLTLDIALGRRQAEIVLALPDADEEHAAPGARTDADAERAAESPMLEVPAEVQAVLARISLPVSELNALRVGDSLPLPRDRLDDTALVTIGGRPVARGRLGQMNGSRAVRLMSAQSIPRAASEARELAFDPLASPSGAGAPPPPDLAEPDGGFPMMDTQPDGAAFPPLDGDIDADALASLSPQEAAEQITELAGLSADDLASGPGSDFPGSGLDMSEFASAPLDLNADLATPDETGEG